MSEQSRFFVLRATSQDDAFDDMLAYASALQAAGLGRLRHAASEGVPHGERFRWTLQSRKGRLSAVIHDDETMPAMVLEVTGPAGLMNQALPLAESSFDIAPAKEVIETAKAEQRDDPMMLVVAAWVAEKEDEAAPTQLLKDASEDADVRLRRAAARAAAVQATGPLRELVASMAAKETDAELASQLRTLLDRWIA